MSKKIFYAEEINEEVKKLMVDEISNFIYDWNDADPECKLHTIKGMYLLAAAIDEFFVEKKEDE